MGFKLIRTDSEESLKIQLQLCKYSIGRGKFLDCQDKRVSKCHAELDVTFDNVILKALHQNPCFIKTNGSEETHLLKQDCSQVLHNGDKFGLLPDSYWYELLECQDTSDDAAGVDLDVNDAENVQVKQEADDTNTQINELTSPSDTKIDKSQTIDMNCDDSVDNNVPDSPSLITTDHQPLADETNSGTSEEKEPQTKHIKEEIASPKRRHSPELPDSSIKKVKTEPRGDQSCTDSQAGPSNEKMASNTDKDGAPQSSQQATPNPIPRERCIYGANCYRRNPQHKAQFSHPTDSDYGTGERGVCPYGAGCRRRDARHWLHHDHPPGAVRPHHNAGNKRKPKKRTQRNSSDDDDLTSADLIVQGKRTRKTILRKNNWSASESEKEEDPFGTDESDEWQPSSDMTDSQLYTQDM